MEGDISIGIRLINSIGIVIGAIGVLYGIFRNRKIDMQNFATKEDLRNTEEIMDLKLEHMNEKIDSRYEEYKSLLEDINGKITFIYNKHYKS